MLSKVSNGGLSTYFKATSNAVRVSQVGTPVKMFYNDEVSHLIPDERKEVNQFQLVDLSGKFNAKSIAVRGMSPCPVHL